MSYKILILRFTPKYVHIFVRDIYFIFRMLPNYFYDFKRFLLYSGLNKSRTYQAERASRITLFYHQVEKGLSLANPRPGFGMTVIPRLLNDIDTYIAAYGLVVPATTALAALKNYVEFNNRCAHDVSYVRDHLKQIIQKYNVTTIERSSWVGGVSPTSRASLIDARAGTFTSFFESRLSIRNFAGGLVPMEDIRRAVRLSQKTPSVCNRQSWRVHAFSDSQKMHALLEIQSGSRGFSEKISTVLVVSTELGCFLDVAERYQAWIDGGMFSMSLCLALHDLGYGTCCLNWSKERDSDRVMHTSADIPDSEQIIMMIAVGNLPESFDVARSFRPPVEHCLRIH
jgi:nitroreductase